MNKIIFSVILPIYKQEEQVPYIIQSYAEALGKSGESWELILVVNGEKDNSFSVAGRVIGDNKKIKAFNLKEGGWGRAVRYGLSVASGEYMCYTNSARTNISDLMLMLKYAKVNDEAVIKATRIIRESFLRKLGSVLYNFENRFLFKTPVWDVNGTPKIIPARVLAKFEIISDGDLIDAEIMAKCFKNNIPIIEIPVVSTQRISGKTTTNIRSALKMYRGLLRLRKKI